VDDGALLRVEGLVRRFPVRGAFGRPRGHLVAVDGVSFDLRPGAVMGLVGESGSGKTTLAKTIAGIDRPDAGRIRFDGVEIAGLTPAQARPIRRRLQYGYQDSGASLDPRWSIGRSLEEPLVVHTTLKRAERRARVGEILAAVGLPAAHLDLHPHELSGGQQRRVGLARILTLHPKLVILDEPTAGLDVSVQATVLALLADLRRRFDLTYLVISHDLAVIRAICTEVAVMYLGRIVETADTEALFAAPRHPYTRRLLDAIPVIGGRRMTDAEAMADVALERTDPLALPSGCRYRIGCPRVDAHCVAIEPALADHDGGRVACHHPWSAA
jgi:oligopeptide/dipeptide ABC transporter ATP-binding protein